MPNNEFYKGQATNKYNPYELYPYKTFERKHIFFTQNKPEK